ncbi:hypothetical protein [Streptomyces boncukensis]|uniref:Uncharacterized protein n=1 Tax=Streptomyces boncukensis TaxID=2711219 RepID=A0A6G4X7K7_9ACTN|nr:hypothetical protein [Streptomyces boncukensis]NGO73529.1 hypothetical protein [Streptomyces boncukensis]
MSTHDDSHVQEVWYLAPREAKKITGLEEVAIELWVDDETVKITGPGGIGGGYSADRKHIVTEVIPQFERDGWRVTATYKVNDPIGYDEEDDDR